MKAKGGKSGRQVWIAQHDTIQSATIRHPGREDAPSIDTVVVFHVCHEIFDELQIIRCAVVSDARVAEPRRLDM